jgi:hypothetical protein
MRARLPVKVRCQNLMHDHQHNYTCLAFPGRTCAPIQAGTDLSGCPHFVGPGPAPPRPAPAIDDDDDLTEHCPCAGS